MAHEHLHFKHDIAVEHTHGKQVRVSIALLGTLAGGMLLLNTMSANQVHLRRRQLPGRDSRPGRRHSAGAPIVWHAIKSLLEKESHMDELVALAIVAAIATQQYVAAGVVAFFMLLSELVESRTALGARVSIESLVKLTPSKANRLTSRRF